ncbi:hypothetical protein M405DRAFT_804271, partial [Rhizopogon salebrosus TDB-379]
MYASAMSWPSLSSHTSMIVMTRLVPREDHLSLSPLDLLQHLHVVLCDGSHVKVLPPNSARVTFAVCVRTPSVMTRDGICREKDVYL